jgi:mono/diheme cytochrome c family protein
MMELRRVRAWLICLSYVGLLAGCNRTSDPTPAGPPPGPAAQGEFDSSGPFAAGKKAVVAGGCFRCHTINGVRGPVGGGAMAGGPPGRGGGGQGGMGGGMGRKAPDLGKEGVDPEHTVEWFVKFVRNPKAVKPDAKMPPLDDKRISENDLRAVAEYLNSLK